VRVSRTFLLLVLSGLLFGYLMGLRTGLFRHERHPALSVQKAPAEKEEWLSIYQGGQKTGYSHRRLVRREGGFLLTEDTLMRLNTMGTVHTLRMRSSAGLGLDMSLSDVDFSLQSKQFSFHAAGRVEAGQLVVTVDGRRQARIPLDGPIYLSGSVLDAVDAAELKAGRTVRMPIFDPSSLGRQMVEIRSEGRERIRIMDREVSALKVVMTVKGATMTAWLDEDGAILQESGLLGMSFKRVSRESALDIQGLSAGADLTREVSVDAGRIIGKPEQLSRLRVRMEGAGPALFLDGGRQRFDRGVLTVERESVPDPDSVDVSPVREYLRPTALMEADDPAIIEVANRITKQAGRMRDKARRLVSWVYAHIEKKPVISVPSALQTLEQRQGDCNEHAILLAALARAAGIPAQVEAGLVYAQGRFYYHAWDVLYLGRWVTADALMNEMPADVTHLRLVRGDLSRQMDILGAIGKIKLTVLAPDEEKAHP
jgi:hypothetical protein